jgi:hypothetical protein
VAVPMVTPRPRRQPGRVHSPRPPGDSGPRAAGKWGCGPARPLAAVRPATAARPTTEGADSMTQNDAGPGGTTVAPRAICACSRATWPGACSPRRCRPGSRSSGPTARPGGGHHHRHRDIPARGAPGPRPGLGDRGGRDPGGVRAGGTSLQGEEAAAGYLAQIDQPGTRMARVGVRPTWAGVIDFEIRLPSSLGGVTGRGQDGWYLDPLEC